MSLRGSFRDSLYQLAAIGNSAGIALVRLLSVSDGNTYSAKFIQFDENGDTEIAENESYTVTNLAEPAGTTGQVPANTDAVAVDVEGRWVTFVSPIDSVMFPAKIVSSSGAGAYSVREQSATGAGTFANKTDTSNITAYNLAELNLGSGGGVDTDEIALVMAIVDTSNPPVIRYVFDHPVYAKYMS